MRTHGSRKQQDVMKSVNAAQMQKVFEVVYVNFKFLFWVPISVTVLCKNMIC